MNFVRITSIILLTFYCFSTKAQHPIKVTTAEAYPLITPECLYTLVDSTAALSIHQVAANTALFKPSRTLIPHYPVTKSNFWIHFKVKNELILTKVLITVQNPLLQNVTFYYKGESDSFSSTQITKDKPLHLRSYFSQNPVFSLPLSSHEVVYDCFLLVSGFTELQTPIYIGTAASILKNTEEKDYSFGIYTGIMLVIFLYNLFIFFIVKDRSYFFYSIYIACVGFVQISLEGFGYKYLWSSHAEFEKTSPFVFSALTAFTSIAFIRNFLQVKLFTPKLNYGLSGIFVLYAITLALALSGFMHQAYNLLNILASLLSLLMLWIAIYIRKTEHTRSSLFFIISWSTFLSSIMVFVLKDIGVLPYNNITTSSLQIGSAAEAILLSIALADRINVLKKEKEASQAEALKVSLENERIIREQNILLEQKVDERTHELNEVNTDLNTAMTKLKDAQTQLVDAEKMASLGQLTAGVAHEINNPINFVSSNIKPLKRDVDDIIELLSKYEHLGSYNLPDDAKTYLTEIESFKAEIDYTYICEEIDILLRGMQEGANRTVEIVKSLKNFSRLDEADLKYVNVNEGINSTLILLNNQLGDRVKITKDLGSIPDIECYPGKLNQVFMNVLNNAIYAVRKREGEPGLITAKTWFENEQVVIKITDNGIGIPPEIKAHIFDPFFTTKDVGEGTGLGLSIVYKIIESHNGTIEVESELGVGTEFTIKLPKSQN
jgi:signal transduction histidine kinase